MNGSDLCRLKLTPLSPLQVEFSLWNGGASSNDVFALADVAGSLAGRGDRTACHVSSGRKSVRPHQQRPHVCAQWFPLSIQDSLHCISHPRDPSQRSFFCLCRVREANIANRDCNSCGVFYSFNRYYLINFCPIRFIKVVSFISMFCHCFYQVVSVFSTVISIKYRWLICLQVWCACPRVSGCACMPPCERVCACMRPCAWG